MPRRRLSQFLGALCSTLFVASGAVGHHSGLYDEERIGDVTGTVESVAWINPHVTIELRVGAADGSIELWRLEGTSVNALERWGLGPDLFAVGDRITARGPMSKFHEARMIAAMVTLADGSDLVLWPNIADRLGLAETGVAGLFPAPANTGFERVDGIFRVWTPRGRPRTDAAELPLTGWAQAGVADYNALEHDPALRCIPPGMPVMLDTPYPIEFVDGGSTIEIRFEEWDARRTVYMEPGNGPPVQEPSPRGFSFGRWEGSTLAILTTHIDYPFFDDVGTPQSRDVVVMERYTPSNNGTRLDWHVIVTDPAAFTEPVERRGYMAWEPGEVIKPFNCTLLDSASENAR